MTDAVATLPAIKAPRRSRLWGDRVLLLAVGGLVALALLVILGPFVWPHDPNAVDLTQDLRSPSLGHPMGTDNVGRDVLARFFAGARTSLGAGLLIVVAGAVLGCITGLLAGSLRGPVDAVLAWLTNSILCFPSIMLAMAVVMALKPGVLAVVVGLSIHSFPWYMRTLRSEVLRISALDFVKSTHAIGATRWRVLSRHVLPHLVSTLVLQMAAVFGASVLALAALGFLGLGAQPPNAEWGAMITEGQQYFLSGQWWIAAFPGIGLLVAVSLTTIIADRAREILDPRGEFTVSE